MENDGQLFVGKTFDLKNDATKYLAGTWQVQEYLKNSESLVSSLVGRSKVKGN
jgi:hypothetical protein